MATDLSGAHNPDRSTVGVLGQIYVNTLTGDKWECTAIYNTQARNLNETAYFWTRVDSSGSHIETVKYIENMDSSNKKPLRSLDSGTYVLHGYFTAYEGATHTYTFSTGMLVSVQRSTQTSYVQIFASKDNTIQYLYISDDSVTRKDAKLINMETIANKNTDIDTVSADDGHYPSTKAVKDFVLSKVPDTTVDDSGKVLTVDASGNPAWTTISNG